MVKSIDDLVKCCMMDIMPRMPVIADYFGLDNVDHLSIILGVYQGMIKIKGMDKSILEKAYKKNELDKLIHLKGLIRQKEETHQVQINQLKVEISRLAHL